MTDPITVEADARNEAFRRLGRNVYLFQLIEAALKELVVNANFSGPANQLEKVIATRTKKVSRRSLGNLADDFVQAAYGDKQPTQSAPADVQEPWISFSYKVDSAPELVRKRKKELLLLVGERNKLIHQLLSDVYPHSTEKWLKLGLHLDDQRERLLVEFENLRSLLRELNQGRQEIATTLKEGLPANTHVDKGGE